MIRSSCSRMVFLCTLSACRSAPTLQEIDQPARRTQAQTIVLSEKLSVYSPYEWFATKDFTELIESELDSVFELFEIEPEVPVLIWLRPHEEMGLDLTVEPGRFSNEGVSLAPESGILGFAVEREVVVHVPPVQYVIAADGRRIPGTLAASMFQDTIRHELAHVASLRTGLRCAPWLCEGIAHLVEWVPMEQGSPVLDPVPEELELAASIPAQLRSIDRMLAWHQDMQQGTNEDRLMRVQALSFVTFFLQKERAPTFREGIERLAAVEDDQVRELEPEWSGWLDGLPRDAP